MMESFLSGVFSSGLGIRVWLSPHQTGFRRLLFALIDLALEGQGGFLDLQAVVAQFNLFHHQVLTGQAEADFFDFGLQLARIVDLELDRDVALVVGQPQLKVPSSCRLYLPSA